EKAQNIIIEEKCNGCGKCLEACPFGAIVFLSKKNIVAKCDLCAACINFCPPKVLRIVDSDFFSYEKAREAINEKHSEFYAIG
ncbi:MAG: 4Fe-4S binding protein, partial [Candidatus Thermoplasmatota archaeon]